MELLQVDKDIYHLPSPRGFKDAIGFGYVGAYFKGWWAKSIGLTVVLKHSESF